MTPGYRWAARMEAALQVGGDFYDFVTTADGAVLLILGDVSGKGISAAMMQSSLTTLFRVHAAATSDPDTIASRMSEALLSQTGGQPYATAILARFDRFPWRITYVNAGHPPASILRGGGTLELSEGGPPLGLLPNVGYDSACIDLAPGDIGVLVTDGVTEVIDGIPVVLKHTLENGDVPQPATRRISATTCFGSPPAPLPPWCGILER